METVGIAQEAVAGVDPAALADRLCGLVRPVPVQRRIGIAADPQNTFLVVADLAAVLVLQHDFIAGNAQAGRAEFFLLGAVGEIDVEGFRGAESFDDLESRQRLPAVENFRRQYLGGRQRHPQRGEIGGRRAFGLGQRGVERGQSVEYRRPVFFDRLEDRCRLRLAGQQQRRRTDREREGDGVAKAVGEENLRHREADVIGRKLEHVACKSLLAIGHVMLQMHDALGASGRAG